MRFHLIGLSHLPASKLYGSCAFTCKNVKLAKMLLSLGHEVFLYGARSREGPQPECSEFVETHTVEDIARDYGDGDNRYEVGYAWPEHDFRHDFNFSTKERKPSTQKFYTNAIAEVNRRKRADDFLLLSQGYYHKPISDAVGLYLSCEPGVGYRGCCHRFKAFESAYIQNFTYGSQNPFKCINGNWYDRVIPNYFDPDDVEYSGEKDDYYLFVGRMIRRKGILTAALACNAIGKRLVIAGQGGAVDRRGHLVPVDHPDFDLAPGTWEYVGYVDVERRKRLMARAIATFTPTEYLECFAGVHVESMLSGTPPITTDFGVFPGTIPDCVNGRVGFRCNTLQDFVDAARAAPDADRAAVRRHGERFLMGNVRWEYQKWFSDLYALWESTVDAGKKGWHRLR